MLLTKFQIDEKEDISWYFMRNAYNQMIQSHECLATIVRVKMKISDVRAIVSKTHECLTAAVQACLL